MGEFLICFRDYLRNVPSALHRRDLWIAVPDYADYKHFVWIGTQ